MLEMPLVAVALPVPRLTLPFGEELPADGTGREGACVHVEVSGATEESRLLGDRERHTGRREREPAPGGNQRASREVDEERSVHPHRAAMNVNASDVGGRYPGDGDVDVEGMVRML